MDFADWNLKLRFEISFLLLWNRRSAFLQYCTLLFQNWNVSTVPLTWRGKFGMCPQCKWTRVVMCNVHTCHRHRSWPCGSTGPVPGTAQDKIFQNHPHCDLWNSSYQKSFGKVFFRVWKNVCHAGGRTTPHVPHPRSQGQLAAVYTMVQSCYLPPPCISNRKTA